MMFEDVIYTGPPIDDVALLREVPPELAPLLVEDNGFVAFRGGLHVRGACTAPSWHSLRAAWRGPQSFRHCYPGVQPTDIPFAEDALGDQFLLRVGAICRLLTETGEIEALGVTLPGFLEQARRDPVGYLSLEPLLAFEADGGKLEPGQLLNVHPPYCVNAGEARRSFRAISAADRLGYLASIAKQIRNLPDGTVVKFKVVK